MVDNVELNAGSGGAIVAADDIAGVWHQRVKCQFGADGSATDVSSGAPLPVTVISSTAITPGGAAANLGKAEDAAAASGDTGVLMLGVRRDAAAVGSDTDGDYSTLNLDANGRLHVLEPSQAAIAASLSVLDDWDETDRAKVNLIVGQAGIAAGAGAVGVTVPRVTLASDDPAVTALQIIDDWDETDRAKVNIIAGQAGITAGAGAVGASTPRVTLASDDPAVALLGTIDTDTGNIVTAVQLIDNIVKLEDDAAASADAGVPMLVVRRDTAAVGSGTDGDYSNPSVDSSGRLWMRALIEAHATIGGASPYQNLNVNAAISVVKASAGKLFGIHVMNLTNPGAVVYLKFWDEASADIGSDTPVFTMPVPHGMGSLGAGFVFPIPPMGVGFANGICIAATGASAPLDETSLSTSAVIVNLIYL